MLKAFFQKIVLLFIITSATAQVEKEVAPPYNVKTISFVQSNQNVIPIFKLGEGFQLQFDDLFGNEADYYYDITHCDYNWNPTEIGIIVSASLSPLGLSQRFEINGPVVRLGPNATLSFSMILHELITNAVKYGSLSVEGGSVKVALVDRRCQR